MNDSPFPRLTPMPLAAYLAIDAWQSSTIHAAERSLLKARWARDHSTPATKATSLGSAGHTAILEPDRFALDCAVYTESKTVGEGSRKKWQAFQEVNVGKNILDVKTYDAACRMRDSAHAHEVAGPYLRKGLAEHVLTWRDPATGVLLKMRPDFIPADFPRCYVSLKTTRAPAPWAFGREISKYGYHRSEALYQRGFLDGLGEFREPIMIAVENVPPWEVFVYYIPAPVLTAAWGERDDGTIEDKSIASLLTGIAGCEAIGKWPGGCRELLAAQIPEYIPGAEEPDAEGTILSGGD